MSSREDEDAGNPLIDQIVDILTNAIRYPSARDRSDRLVKLLNQKSWQKVNNALMSMDAHHNYPIFYALQERSTTLMKAILEHLDDPYSMLKVYFRWTKRELIPLMHYACQSPQWLCNNTAAYEIIEKAVNESRKGGFSELLLQMDHDGVNLLQFLCNKTNDKLADTLCHNVRGVELACRFLATCDDWQQIIYKTSENAKNQTMLVESIKLGQTRYHREPIPLTWRQNILTCLLLHGKLKDYETIVRRADNPWRMCLLDYEVPMDNRLSGYPMAVGPPLVACCSGASGFTIRKVGSVISFLNLQNTNLIRLKEAGSSAAYLKSSQDALLRFFCYYYEKPYYRNIYVVNSYPGEAKMISNLVNEIEKLLDDPVVANAIPVLKRIYFYRLFKFSIKCKAFLNRLPREMWDEILGFVGEKDLLKF